MNKLLKKGVFGLLATLILVAIDQGTKYFAYTILKENGPMVLIEGVFEFHYLTNAGAAWGMFSGQRIIFILLTLVIMLGIIYAYMKTPMTKKYGLLFAAELLFASGAIGNLIDRCANGYVHDFLYFSLINFPIFNVADCYVVIGAFVLAVAVLFVYKDENDFDFLSFKRK